MKEDLIQLSPTMRERGVSVYERDGGGEWERDRDCPSWRSLLGAGSVFGSAHCIISSSPNPPEQMEKGPTCSTSCIIKSFRLCAPRVYRTLLPHIRHITYMPVCISSSKCQPPASMHGPQAGTRVRGHSPRFIGRDDDLCSGLRLSRSRRNLSSQLCKQRG